VDEIVLHAEREVAADGAGGGFGAVGRAHHAANNADGLAALQDDGQGRSGGEELQQGIIKRFAGMNRIMLGRQFFAGNDKFGGSQAQALALESRKNLAGQLALHAIGFNENECLLHCFNLGSGTHYLML
jgi:hypothetical protein